MRKILTCFLLFIAILLDCTNSFAQPNEKLETKVEAKIKYLRKSNIDTVMSFMPYIQGGKHVVTISRTATKEETRLAFCEHVDVAYVIWQEKGKTNIVKFNECWEFRQLTVDSFDILKKFASNYYDISRFPMKPFRFISKSGDTITSGIDHRGIWDVSFYFQNMNYAQSIDLYLLSKSSYDGSETNINFQYNTNLMQVKILSMLAILLSDLKFTRDTAR